MAPSGCPRLGDFHKENLFSEIEAEANPSYPFHALQSHLPRNVLRERQPAIRYSLLQLNTFAAIIIFFGLIILPLPSLAAKYTDTRSKHREIKRQIEEKSQKIEETAALENSTLGQIQLADQKLQQVRKELRNYRSTLDRTKLDILMAKQEADKADAAVRKRREWLYRKLKAMQRLGPHGDLLLMVASSDDLPAAARRMRYLDSLSRAERGAIEKFSSEYRAYIRRHNDLLKLYDKSSRQEKEVLMAEKTLSREKARREEMLSSIRSEKKTYERLLGELKKASSRMERVIRESERKREASFEGKGFRQSKGSLPWPASGRVSVPYGSQRDPRLDTPVFRNGVYIETPEEAMATAVHDGRVVFADWFEGYGQLVIVNHGLGYHTLYGNLSEIFLRTGDIIRKEGSVGRIGSAGVAEGPALYFEIRYKGKPLDPSHWLRRK